MAINGLVIAVTTSPTAIGGDVISTDNNRIRNTLDVVLYNRGAGTIYLGSSGVTTSGYPLTTSDAYLPLRIPASEKLYATSTGTINVNVLRLGEPSGL